MRLFRVIQTETATEADFQSYEAEGRPIPPDAPAEVRRKWGGVSTFTTVELAGEVAAKKALGGFWASLEVPSKARLELDPPRPNGRHITIFAETPRSLLGYVDGTGRFQEPVPNVE
jgi:hypothetical protein